MILSFPDFLPQAVPSQQWRKADPLFEHSLKTRNMFSNPLHTVFGVKAKKVLEESRQVGNSLRINQMIINTQLNNVLYLLCP